MAVVSGVVQEVKDGKRVKINGEWYGSYNPIGDVNAGDSVTFEWQPDKTGKYKNIKGAVNVTGRGGSASANQSGGASTAGSRDLIIVRQNALAHATAIVVAAGVNDAWAAQDLVLRLAVDFARYSATGEFDTVDDIPDARDSDRVPF